MQLPKTISQTTNQESVILMLAIEPALDAFAGHFDAAPIIPGVVQIQWALAFNNQYLTPVHSNDIERMDALKFQQVIQPNSTIRLSLERKENRILFSFSSDAGMHSSGKVLVN